jgi:hypothetical protein
MAGHSAGRAVYITGYFVSVKIRDYQKQASDGVMHKERLCKSIGLELRVCDVIKCSEHLCISPTRSL